MTAFHRCRTGAADLITLRGYARLLAECPVCLYAGPSSHRNCSPIARRARVFVDTAPLSLDEIEAEYVAAHAAGQVGAAAPGDLSVWSAVAEQIRRLDKHGIPGTPSPRTFLPPPQRRCGGNSPFPNWRKASC